MLVMQTFSIACVFSSKARQAVRKHWILNTIWGLFAALIIIMAIIPQDPYTTGRAKVIEGLARASAARTAIHEFWTKHERFPASNTEAEIDEDIAGKYLEGLVIGPHGVVTLI